MGTLIGSVLFALVALWVAGERLLSPLRSLDSATTSVQKELYGSRNGEGQREVTLWRAYPLSDHMIKEFARSKGFRFVGETSKYGSVVLRFEQCGRTGRKAR